MGSRRLPRERARGWHEASPDTAPDGYEPGSREAQAECAVEYWTARANALLAARDGRAMRPPVVRFDLRGRAAGVTVLPRRPRAPAVIRLNEELLGTEPAEMLEETVPHEVAHAAAFWFHGPRIKPHGRQWRWIMRAFGKQPTTCHNLPTRPARRLAYYPYRCDCPRPTYLSAIRHGRVQRAQQRYQCVHCGAQLRYTGGTPSRGHPDDTATG